jgi:hypothetical protein
MEGAVLRGEKPEPVREGTTLDLRCIRLPRKGLPYRSRAYDLYKAFNATAALAYSLKYSSELY